MSKAAGGCDLWIAFHQRTNQHIGSIWKAKSLSLPIGVFGLAAVTHHPKMLVLGSCVHAPILVSSPQLQHLPVLQVLAAWRSCVLLQPTLKSLEQASGRRPFIVGWDHPLG